MTTETTNKLQMTEKNLLKNMKRLNKQRYNDALNRENILSYAYTDSVNTYTTDSHRALKINTVVDNELVKENTDHTERIERLMNEPYSYFEFTANRDDIKVMRNLVKYIASVGGLLTINYKNEDDIKSVTLGMTKEPVYDLQVSMTLSNFDTKEMQTPDYSFKTTVNPKYFNDVLDFAWDNKEQGIRFMVDENNMRPLHVKGLSDDFHYIVLPIRTY